jgi:hypothetical protein
LEKDKADLEKEKASLEKRNKFLYAMLIQEMKEKYNDNEPASSRGSAEVCHCFRKAARRC